MMKHVDSALKYYQEISDMLTREAEELEAEYPLRYIIELVCL